MPELFVIYSGGLIKSRNGSSLNILTRGLNILEQMTEEKISSIMHYRKDQETIANADNESAFKSMC